MGLDRVPMPSRELPLDQLLAAVARGDEAAFAELYQVTSAKLLAVALRILRHREVAEEVLQEAYFRVWERAGSYDSGVAKPMTWLAAIVRNQALDEVRRRGSRPAASADEYAIAGLASDDEHPLVGLERAEDLKRLLECLDGLDEEKRQMVRLAYLEGLSRAELAERYGRPEGTIKTWLHRSLAQLKGCLER